METLLAKLWQVIQSQQGLLTGSFLHFFFSKQIEKESKKPRKTLLDWLLVFVISITLGLTFEFMVIGYYEYQNLMPKPGVLTASKVLGAALGFSGMVWIMNKLKESFDEVRDYALRKDKRQGRDSYGRDEDERF